MKCTILMVLVQDHGYLLFLLLFSTFTYTGVFLKKPENRVGQQLYLSTIILLEIVGKPWWWLLLFLIPGVNIIFAIWMTNLLSISFGKGVGFTIGLLLLNFIFYPILAFSNAEYKGPAGIQA